MWSTKQRTSSTAFSMEPLRAATSVTSHHTIACYGLTCWLIARPKHTRLFQTSVAPAVACWIGHHNRNPPAVKMDKNDQVVPFCSEPQEVYFVWHNVWVRFMGQRTSSQDPVSSTRSLSVGGVNVVAVFTWTRVSVLVNRETSQLFANSVPHESQNQEQLVDPNLNQSDWKHLHQVLNLEWNDGKSSFFPV